MTQPPGYLLRVEPGQYDVARFEQLLADARRDTDPAVSLATLNEALSLWRGPAFAEVAFDDFARTEAARLEELRMTAAEDRVDAKLRLGQHAELVGELEQSVAANPVRERVHAQLMLALYRCGREVEALQTYQNHRRYLASELGLENLPPRSGDSRSRSSSTSPTSTGSRRHQVRRCRRRRLLARCRSEPSRSCSPISRTPHRCGKSTPTR